MSTTGGGGASGLGVVFAEEIAKAEAKASGPATKDARTDTGSDARAATTAAKKETKDADVDADADDDRTATAPEQAVEDGKTNGGASEAKARKTTADASTMTTQEPRGILKNREGKAYVAEVPDDYSSRIQGMGSSGGTSEGQRWNWLAEKTMPAEEKKSRIAALRAIFGHFNIDYARDCLRSYQWEVDTTANMVLQGVLPLFLKDAEPSSYIHDPDNFLEAPKEVQFGGKEGKQSPDFQAALLSVQGQGLIGPVRPPLDIDTKEEECRIATLREICPQYSVDYARELLDAFHWDVESAAEAAFTGGVPETLKSVADPGTYTRTKQAQENQEGKEGKSNEK
eukprot:CAMPEP_0114528692 /NCGR_PEP_ID=MMETSP0109-20121206/24378_1 /TAXON_ID=29199 /ORGANISM="Chlorarachnion reptans, Strain CCCM449" /LENGTH=340 /DNA_ID=CAMNT_0001710927 /DNA_START=252 /DNA_END=1274 /DNA_ORIENTATION=+